MSSLSYSRCFLPIFSVSIVETAIDSQGLRVESAQSGYSVDVEGRVAVEFAVEIPVGVSVNSAESKSGVAKQAGKQADKQAI